jgi:hypothetical protein
MAPAVATWTRRSGCHRTGRTPEAMECRTALQSRSGEGGLHSWSQVESEDLQYRTSGGEPRGHAVPAWTAAR